jgi:hypothetical protein
VAANVLTTVGVLGASLVWSVFAVLGATPAGGAVIASGIVAAAVAVGWWVNGVPSVLPLLAVRIAGRVFAPYLAAVAAVVAWGAALLPNYLVMLVVAITAAAAAAEASRRSAPLPPHDRLSGPPPPPPATDRVEPAAP